MTARRLLAPVANYQAVLFLTVLVALALRMIIRFALGEDFFWSNSYSVYYWLATEYAEQRAVCKSTMEAIEVVGRSCGYLPPLYSLFLTLVSSAGMGYKPIVASQAIISTGTVAVAYLVSRRLFDNTTAILTGVLVCVYPYYVLHDTALQETGVFTFLVTLSMLLLMSVRHSNSGVAGVLTGVVLGLAVLVRTTLLLFVPLAFGWLLYSIPHALRNRLRILSWLALSFGFTISPWLVRSQVAVGGPLMNNHAGVYLWLTNNPLTFSHYPQESMDLSSIEAWNSLTSGELQEIDTLSSENGWQLEGWFARKAIEYIAANPALFVRAVALKVWTAFSWVLNPRKGGIFQTIYFFSYSPILVLGLLGVLETRHRWKEFGLIYMLFISFLLVVAVFFAHTSHRTHLDIFLIIFSAHSIRTMHARRARWLHRVRLLFQRRSANMC